MKNIILPILLISLFSSCDFYKSDFPITNEPSTEIPDTLLGLWYYVDTVDNFIVPKFFIETLEFEKRKYLLAYTYIENKEIAFVDYEKVWLSKIKDKTYLNAKSLQPTTNEYFTIHQYQMGENGQLETTSLHKRFKQKFDTQTNFYKYVKNNWEEFDSYFDTPRISFQRRDSIKWGLVNSLWKDEITSVYTLNRKMEIDEFSNLPDEDLKPILKNENINRDSMIGVLESSFFIGYEQIYFKIKPVFYLLEKKDGTFVKMAINKFRLYDITNQFVYSRK